MENKTCTICKQTKLEDCFSLQSKDNIFYRLPYCKACQSNNRIRQGKLAFVHYKGKVKLYKKNCNKKYNEVFNRYKILSLEKETIFSIKG